MTPGSTQEKPQIFVAYHLDDAKYVESLCHSLRDKGHRISLPPDEVNTERRGYQENAIRKCSIMLVVASPQSLVKSDVVKNQARFFAEARKGRVIALHVQEIADDLWPVPLFNGERIDFLNWTMPAVYSTSLEKLDKRLQLIYKRIEETEIGELPGYKNRPPIPENDSSIKEYYSGFPFDEYESWLCNASKRIMIADVWSSIIARQTTNLREAIRRNAEVTVLLLTPWSSIARKRSLEMNWDYNSIDKHIQETISAVQNLNVQIEQHLGRDAKDRLGLRLYNALPSFPIYVVDNKILYGLIGHAKKSFDLPWFVVTDASDIGRVILTEFNNRLDDSMNYELPPELLKPLSDLQITILKKMGEGKTNKEIAEDLNYGEDTIKGYVEDLYAILVGNPTLFVPGVRKRIAALNRARDLGLID